MQQQWNFNFGPGFITPEDLEAQRQKQSENIKHMVEEKQCVMCNNAILINDQVAICNSADCDKKGQCVDGQNGNNCEHWEPVENLIY